jgi:hypothetical protein
VLVCGIGTISHSPRSPDACSEYPAGWIIDFRHNAELSPERTRDRNVTIPGGVLVAERRSGTGMTGAAREFLGRGTQVAAQVRSFPEVVEMDFGTPERPLGHFPGTSIG